MRRVFSAVDATRRTPVTGLTRAVLTVIPVLTLIPVALLTAAAPAAAVSGATVGPTYYVSATGNDAAAGTSPATAWRTLDRVGRQTLSAGSTVLLQGGRTFSGGLRVTAGQAGSAASPVRIASYGTGVATIAPAGGDGVVIYNTAGVMLSDLRITGNAGTLTTASGINAYNDLPGDRKLDVLRFERLEVSGFRTGIAVGGGNGASGFRAVTIAEVDAHHNQDAGIVFYGPPFRAAAPTYAHSRVLLSRVVAHHNQGDLTERVRNTGNGIVLGSVQDGVVRASRAHANGGRCTAPEGPVGIWAYDADRISLINNVADHNLSGGPADGDGFDLDQNTSRSVMQGNLSFANAGAGFLVYTAQQNDAHHDNLVRYNLSVGDGTVLGQYGGITVWGRTLNTRIEHNTVIARPTGTVRPPALAVDARSVGLAVRNNVLVSDGAGPLVSAWVDRGTTVVPATFTGNDYVARNRPFEMQWISTVSSLAQWQRETGQELDGGRSTALSVDPQLVDPGATLSADPADRIPTDVAGLSGFALAGGSPLRGAAVAAPPVPADVGSSLAGAPLDVFGAAPAPVRSVGAHQPG